VPPSEGDVKFGQRTRPSGKVAQRDGSGPWCSFGQASSVDADTLSLLRFGDTCLNSIWLFCSIHSKKRMLRYVVRMESNRRCCRRECVRDEEGACFVRPPRIQTIMICRAFYSAGYMGSRPAMSIISRVKLISRLKVCTYSSEVDGLPLLPSAVSALVTEGSFSAFAKTA